MNTLTTKANDTLSFTAAFVEDEQKVSYGFNEFMKNSTLYEKPSEERQ